MPFLDGSNFPRGGLAGQVLRKASDADQDTEWGGGAVAATLTVTPDILLACVRKLNIVGVSQASKTFTVLDDKAILFPTASEFTVANSTGNDGIYTVASVELSGAATVITVVEAIPDATADGDITNSANGKTSSGLVIYRPKVGDVGFIAVESSGFFVPTAWDNVAGSTEANFYPEEETDYRNTSFNPVDLTQADQSFDTDGLWTVPQNAPFATNAPPFRFTTTGAMKVVVDDGNYGDPGSTVGIMQLAFLFVPVSE